MCLFYVLVYFIFKFGVEVFLDVFCCELGLIGVKVSIVELGFFQIKIINFDNFKGQWQDFWINLSYSLKEEYGEKFYEISEQI